MERLSLPVVILFALLLSSAWARGEQPADLDAGSQVIERMQQVLPRHGVGDLRINGGAALSLGMGAAHGKELAWNDLDLLSVMKRPLDQATLRRIADDIAKGGFAEVLFGPITFYTTLPDKPGLYPLVEGIRMQHRSGMRFDVPIIYSASLLHLQGYNSAEGLMLPLHKEHDLSRIVASMRGQSPERLVSAGKVVDYHGKARDVLEGRIALINEHFLTTQPELAALRFLRGMQKLAHYGLKVDGQPSLSWLHRELPGLIERAPHPDERTFYELVVKEQATKLVQSGDAASLRNARAMGLDLARLAKGQIRRQPSRRVQPKPARRQ